MAEEAPNDFVYQLQRIDLGAIGETKFELVIMDYSRDGSDAEKFTAEGINALRDNPGGPKTVLSYMSIGEAEDYRWYWQPGDPALLTTPTPKRRWWTSSRA